MKQVVKYIALASIITATLASCKVSNPEKFVNRSLQEAPFDAIIVPGMPYDTTWQKGMKIRMYWAKYLYEQGYTKNIIFSGAAVYTKYSEAKIMKLYALEMGIPEEHIYLDTVAQHSVENVYYSYYVAKYNGFENIAVATDTYQSRFFIYFNRKMKRRLGADIALMPILRDTIMKYPRPDYDIDAEKALGHEFVNIKETQGNIYRIKGTMGKHIDWENPPVPKTSEDVVLAE